MRERQTQKLFTVVGLSFLAFLIGSAVYRSMDRRSVVTVGAGVSLDVEPEVSTAATRSELHLEEFHRVEIKDGKPVWELRANNAKYFEGDNLIQVSDPTLFVYQDDGSKVKLAAKSAKLYSEDETLKEAQLEGDIVLTLPSKTSVVTDYALYKAMEQTVTSQSKVVIRGKGYELTGEGMELDIASESCTLLRDASSYFEMGLDGPGSLLPEIADKS